MRWRKLLGPGSQVLGDENRGPVPWKLPWCCPAAGGVGGLYGIADILAVALPTSPMRMWCWRL